jgi:type 1 fimbriae regulatory protein FimB
MKTLKREKIYANRYEDIGHMRVNIEEFIKQYVRALLIDKHNITNYSCVMKFLTTKQVLQILKVSSESKRNHAMILLAYQHGLRASEVCGLKLKDLDFKNEKITIRRLKGSLETTQSMSNVTGQPLLSELRVLKAWLAERNDASDFVFTSQKGGKLDRTQFFRIFQDVAERADIPVDLRHPHCLKHSLGFTLVEAGAHMAVIKQALGHKSMQSTAVYACATDQMADKARRSAMANLF